MRWDRDLLVSLRLRYLAGEQVERLAAEVGCSTGSLTASWTTYGITVEFPRADHRRHRWTMRLLGEIRDRWLAGETIRSLAEEVGANESTLDSALVRAGFKSPEIARVRRDLLRGRRNGVQVARAYSLRRHSTRSWKEIAEEVGWDRSAVHLRGEVRRFARLARIEPPPRRSRSGRPLSGAADSGSTTSTGDLD